MGKGGNRQSGFRRRFFLRFAHRIMEVDGMDRIDRKIIDILQTNARAPLKEIADRVFLSSPAVSARIAKLEKDGVLTGYQAQVAPLK